MARSLPPGRLTDIADAACATFTTKGYRRTLMSDVADRLGMSVGVLYRSVTSKEALFALALRYAMDPDAPNGETVGGRGSPIGGSLTEALAPLRRWMDANTTFPLLDAAAGRTGVADAHSELAEVIGELYLTVARHRTLLGLIEASTADLPELHAAYVGGARLRHLERLHGYLVDRRARGLLRPVEDAGVATRFVVETVAWFAWHRHGDPTGALLDDDLARRSTVAMLTAALVPDGDRAGPGPVRASP